MILHSFLNVFQVRVQLLQPYFVHYLTIVWEVDGNFKLVLFCPSDDRIKVTWPLLSSAIHSHQNLTPYRVAQVFSSKGYDRWQWGCQCFVNASFESIHEEGALSGLDMYSV